MEELGAAGDHFARSVDLEKREDGSCSGRVRVLAPHHSDASTADTAHDDRFSLDMHPGDDDEVPRGGGAIAAGSRRLRCKTAPEDAGFDDGGIDTTGGSLAALVDVTPHKEGKTKKKKKSGRRRGRLRAAAARKEEACAEERMPFSPPPPPSPPLPPLEEEEDGHGSGGGGEGRSGGEGYTSAPPPPPSPPLLPFPPEEEVRGGGKEERMTGEEGVALEAAADIALREHPCREEEGDTRPAAKGLPEVPCVDAGATTAAMERVIEEIAPSDAALREHPCAEESEEDTLAMGEGEGVAALRKHPCREEEGFTLPAAKDLPEAPCVDAVVTTAATEHVIEEIASSKKKEKKKKKKVHDGEAAAAATVLGSYTAAAAAAAAPAAKKGSCGFDAVERTKGRRLQDNVTTTAATADDDTVTALCSCAKRKCRSLRKKTFCVFCGGRNVPCT